MTLSYVDDYGVLGLLESLDDCVSPDIRVEYSFVTRLSISLCYALL